MDERFSAIISQIEGIVSPEEKRLLALEELVYSQALEEKLDLIRMEKTARYLYDCIYEEDLADYEE
jgi:hypothetical protein